MRKMDSIHRGSLIFVVLACTVIGILRWEASAELMPTFNGHPLLWYIFPFYDPSSPVFILIACLLGGIATAILVHRVRRRRGGP